MNMTGERLILATQSATWAALNDPAILKACLPGCESIEQVGPDEFGVLMTARAGPVTAKFKGKLTLADIVAPTSYMIIFEGQGGTAGFAKGTAKVRLSPEGEATKLWYEANATVGGKIAQVGSRLVDSAAKKVAEDFFAAFNECVQQVTSADATEERPVGNPASQGVAQRVDEAEDGERSTPSVASARWRKTLLTVALAGAVLVVIWLALF